MPVFVYKGVGVQGKNVSGTIDAESEKAARGKLRKMRVMPTHVVLQGDGTIKGLQFLQTVSIQEIANMTRQMAVLLGAGIPLLDTLEALVNQVKNVLIRKAIGEIRDRVKEGGRLADCMSDYPKIFSNIYIYMVRAGEASGQLETVLNRLADFTEGQAKLKSKIKSALMYPVIMMIVATGIVSFLVLNVAPKIIGIFKKSGGTLPWATRVLMGFTDFLEHYWLITLIGVGLIVFVFIRYKKSPAGKLTLDRLSLRFPLFGPLQLKVAVARFSRTLCTLLKSGVQLLPALEIVKNVMDNKILEQVIVDVMKDVKEGESLAEPLARSGIFPDMFLQMIRVGEKTGALDAMLERVADTYDNEVDTFVEGMTSILEPAMIVGLGGVIAFIVMAILMPIMQMSQLAGKH